MRATERRRTLYLWISAAEKTVLACCKCEVGYNINDKTARCPFGLRATGPGTGGPRPGREASGIAGGSVRVW